MKTNKHFCSYLAQLFLYEKLFRQTLKRKSEHIIYVQKYFFLDGRAVHEMMWKNIVEPERLQTTIRRMRIACWLPKPTNTHSE